MASLSFGFPSNNTTPPFVNTQGDFSTPTFLYDLAQLGTSTFLANQAITSPRPSTFQVLPGGGVVAAGGGAGLTAGSGASLLANPLVWVIGIVLLIVLLKA